MIKAQPHGCEEMVGIPGGGVLPCNKPATKVIDVNRPGSSEGPYRMCDGCADHSVRNRSMKLVGPYERERLTGVAIKRGEEVLKSVLHSHWQLRKALDHSNKEPQKTIDGDIDGFVTSTGRFVDRAEAKAVALDCGQIGQQWKTPGTRALLSSDIDW